MARRKSTPAGTAAPEGAPAYEEWVRHWRGRFAAHYKSRSPEEIDSMVRSLLTSHCAWAREDDPMTAYALSIGAVSPEAVDEQRRRLKRARGAR